MSEFENLRTQLLLQEWPNLYYFKFIVPSKSENIALLTGLFDTNVEINLHPSSKGSYTSVGAKVIMLDVDSIIHIYKQAAKIAGVISL